MALDKIPGRIFLDTSVVNFWLDYGQEIGEGIEPPPNIPMADVEDIEALHWIYMTGQRVPWQLAISPHTYQEVLKTTDPKRRHYLENWFFEIWYYWMEIIQREDDLPSFVDAEAEKVRLLSSGILEVLPDITDRILILDAVVYNCDLFCTRDRKTIIKHRDRLSSINIPIATPTEWWEIIEPKSRLFC